jgi:hypothetical protein
MEPVVHRKGRRCPFSSTANADTDLIRVGVANRKFEMGHKSDCACACVEDEVRDRRWE